MFKKGDIIKFISEPNYLFYFAKNHKNGSFSIICLSDELDELDQPDQLIKAYKYYTQSHFVLVTSILREET